MEEVSIPFRPITVLINALISFAFWIFVINGIVHHYQNLEFLFWIVFVIIITNGFSYYIKALVAFISWKPALQLTHDAYIDHVANVKFKWEDIQKFGFYSIGRHKFLSIEIKNYTEYRNSIKNPISRIYNWANFLMTGFYLHTNISFIKLKENDPLKTLETYRAKAIMENRKLKKIN